MEKRDFHCETIAPADVLDLIIHHKMVIAPWRNRTTHEVFWSARVYHGKLEFRHFHGTLSKAVVRCWHSIMGRETGWGYCPNCGMKLDPSTGNAQDLQPIGDHHG